MAFCPNCGTQLPENASVCPNCGVQLNAPAAAASATDHTAEYTAEDVSKNKVLAMAAYLLGTIGIILALLAAHDSPYVAFHSRQALKLDILSILSLIFSIIPILGWIATGVCALILFVVRIICFFQVCKGQAKDAPIVSSIGFMN